jgi:signal transduction histidine kinase
MAGEQRGPGSRRVWTRGVVFAFLAAAGVALGLLFSTTLSNLYNRASQSSYDMLWFAYAARIEGAKLTETLQRAQIPGSNVSRDDIATAGDILFGRRETLPRVFKPEISDDNPNLLAVIQRMDRLMAAVDAAMPRADASVAVMARELIGDARALEAALHDLVNEVRHRSARRWEREQRATVDQLAAIAGVAAVLLVALLAFGGLSVVQMWRLERHRERLTALSENLRAAQQAAEAANHAKSQFLANMSHELRTPLNAVIGFSQVLEGQMLGPLGVPRYREYATDIRSSGEYLLSIISDILDLAKIEAKEITLERTRFELQATIKTCCTLVAKRADQGQVSIEVAPLPHLPALLADQLRVKQVLINLLSNAVKFSPPGGRVGISAGIGADGGIAISVADNGVGMTAEEVTLALQPFRQVNASVAARNEGSGLGLPIATSLMEMHGGTLHIDSMPGRGTTVTINFPPDATVHEPVSRTSAAA